MNEIATEPSGLRDRRLTPRLIVSVVAAGIMSFAGVVVETAMNVTFPTLMREFAIDTATVQWVTTGYLLVLSIVIPTSSYLRRRFTLRTLFVAGSLCFLAGTIAAALAPSFAILLAGRLVQGAGTGIALPLMFNIILEQVPQRNMGLMIGIGNFITAAAPAIGPSFGGFLVSAVGWRAVFWALVPLIVVAFIMGAVCIRQVSRTERAALDVPGLIMLAIGFASFIFAANSASSAGWTSPQVLGLFAVAVAAIGLFCRRSLTTSGALLNVGVFRSPVFALSVVAILLVQLCTLGLGFLIPNHAQLVLGVDAFTAGCLLVPGCLVGAVLSPCSGVLLDRLGAARPIVAGCALVVVAMLLFTTCAPMLSVGLVIALYIVYAIGMGASQPSNMTNGLAHLTVDQNADGNAVINTVQQLAGAIGTVLVSTIVASAQAANPIDSMAATVAGTQRAFMLLLVFAVVETLCVIVIFGVIGNRKVARA